MPKVEKTVLAFDFGLRNIGMAVGQTRTNTGQMLSPLTLSHGVMPWQKIERIIEQWQPDLLVVGIPVHMDGSESSMTQKARRFGHRLQGRFHLPWYAADERLSSYEAKAWSKETGHQGNYRENPIDSVAALIILESWLGQQAIR